MKTIFLKISMPVFLLVAGNLNAGNIPTDSVSFRIKRNYELSAISGLAPESNYVHQFQSHLKINRHSKWIYQVNKLNGSEQKETLKHQPIAENTSSKNNVQLIRLSNVSEFGIRIKETLILKLMKEYLAKDLVSEITK